DGIRSNAVNADRIRSGLLTPEMIAARAEARGLSEEDYMAGNLLSREVTAEDVAQAFLHQALALKTTADVTTVDGGHMAASIPREDAMTNIAAASPGRSMVRATTGARRPAGCVEKISIIAKLL